MNLPTDGIRLEFCGAQAVMVFEDDFDISRENLAFVLLRHALRGGPEGVEFDFCAASFVGGVAVRLVLEAREHCRGTVGVRADDDVWRLFELTGAAGLVQRRRCNQREPSTTHPKDLR